jgi:prepilin-type N-terminal cleavage/methylation domain-containing protein
MKSVRAQFRSGFTLVELMMAVLLLALLTSAVALSFSGPIQRARGQDAIEQIRSFDAAARDAARREGREVRMALDLSAGTLARREGADLESLRCQIALPPGFRIEQLRVAGQTYSDGEAVIDVSSLGLSRSYGIHLVGPGLDQWLVFAGQGGNMTRVQDEETMSSILERAAPVAYRAWEQTARNHAD